MAVHTMDVVTTYLYGSLNTNIYMKVPPRLDTTNASALFQVNIIVLNYNAHYMVSNSLGVYGTNDYGNFSLPITL